MKLTQSTDNENKTSVPDSNIGAVMGEEEYITSSSSGDVSKMMSSGAPPLKPENVIALQRQIGNRATSQFVQRHQSLVQKKSNKIPFAGLRMVGAPVIQRDPKDEDEASDVDVVNDGNQNEDGGGGGAPDGELDMELGLAPAPGGIPESEVEGSIVQAEGAVNQAKEQHGVTTTDEDGEQDSDLYDKPKVNTPDPKAEDQLLASAFTAGTTVTDEGEDDDDDFDDEVTPTPKDQDPSFADGFTPGTAVVDEGEDDDFDDDVIPTPKGGPEGLPVNGNNQQQVGKAYNRLNRNQGQNHDDKVEDLLDRLEDDPIDTIIEYRTTGKGSNAYKQLGTDVNSYYSYLARPNSMSANVYQQLQDYTPSDGWAILIGSSKPKHAKDYRLRVDHFMLMNYHEGKKDRDAARKKGKRDLAKKDPYIGAGSEVASGITVHSALELISQLRDGMSASDIWDLATDSFYALLTKFVAIVAAIKNVYDVVKIVRQRVKGYRAALDGTGFDEKTKFDGMDESDKKVRLGKIAQFAYKQAKTAMGHAIVKLVNTIVTWAMAIVAGLSGGTAVPVAGLIMAGSNLINASRVIYNKTKGFVKWVTNTRGKKRMANARDLVMLAMEGDDDAINTIWKVDPFDNLMQYAKMPANAAIRGVDKIGQAIDPTKTMKNLPDKPSSFEEFFAELKKPATQKSPYNLRKVRDALINSMTRKGHNVTNGEAKEMIRLARKGDETVAREIWDMNPWKIEIIPSMKSYTRPESKEVFKAQLTGQKDGPYATKAGQNALVNSLASTMKSTR